MKFNRGGLICVGLYASYVLFMLAVAYLALDGKTRGFFLALSALPGWLVVGAMPEAPMEWLLVNYYPVVGVGVYLVSFAVAYLSGCILEQIIISIAPTLRRIDHWWFDRVRGDDR
ncbi:hypothetical protein PMI42_00566 [Bradyrhizobium sp. YR681]|uniref:hypothetical protein n=1 Tax=Bradyrhizobium sp. YR681 TaxID=1144344 RepID=UPI0002714821|nr:hypothetical protein [Bradyrhizobium sp. YR681]EJN15801.1 hypothetical protein PMI42_00566 [Bradyrhizobium sp. YR681]